MDVHIRRRPAGEDAGLPEACDQVLRCLPEWFGIESAIVAYVDAVRTRPTVTVEVAGAVVGFVALTRHFDRAAELHVLGLRREHHGRGLGRRMIEAAETWLAEDGVRFVQVKTMGPSKPDAHYARTTAFYRAIGYEPLEELHGLWGALPALVLVKRLDADA